MGGALGKQREENTEGPCRRAGTPFPFPLQLLPQSGAVCWSSQTFLSLRNTVIVSVCE